MNAFPNTWFRIASAREVEEVVRDRHIVRSLIRDPGTPCLRRLAAMHGVTVRDGAKSFKRLQGFRVLELRITRAVGK
jgi:hypothetical protein